MSITNFTIEQITRENYHMFFNMVQWRMNGVELTEGEKESNKLKEFIEVPKNLEYPGLYVYGACCDERFVGWISIVYIPKIGRLNKGVIYIDELWVAPEFRRNGIAACLVKKAFDCQKDTGAVEVRLYTEDDNIPAQELYKKSGLKIEGKVVYMVSEQTYN